MAEGDKQLPQAVPPNSTCALWHGMNVPTRTYQGTCEQSPANGAWAQSTQTGPFSVTLPGAAQEESGMACFCLGQVCQSLNLCPWIRSLPFFHQLCGRHNWHNRQHSVTGMKAQNSHCP